MLVTDLSMRMSVSAPRPVRVGLVVDELVKEQVLYRVLSASPCQYHAPSAQCSIIHLKATISVTDSIVKQHT
jgi:hypothetical protein